MNDDFDPSVYVRPPVLTVSRAVGLARALLAAAPQNPSPGVKKAALALRIKAIALQQIWANREQEAKPPDPRPADRAIDTSWAALHDRLEGYALLPTKEYPRASRAQELLDALFPEGLTFLRLPFAEEWAESERRIHRIENEGLAHDLDVLCGREFLAEVRRAHAAYGDAIGVTKPVPTDHDGERSLVEPLRQLTRAIGKYAVQVVATADSDDPATVTAARAALAPLDRVRSAASRRSKPEKEEPTTPQSPMPNAPGAA
jgi:hypothetical protein